MPNFQKPIPENLLDPRFESLPTPPPPNPEFSNRLDGVVIPVWEGDIYLAKACCASIRQSMGDIPITLLVDGADADTRDIQRLPNVSRMVLQDVVDAEIVRLCTGTCCWPKIILFWMSPYERFLCLDSDTLVWGDLRAHANFDQFDFIATYRFTNPMLFHSTEELQHSAFDVETVMKLDPAMDWRGKEASNAGAFFARRGVFSKENLMVLRRLDCWRTCENGMVHYLLWRAAREGIPRTTGYRLQLFPADETSEPEDRFLPRNGQKPAILHWISRKPKLGRRFQASDDYRKLFLKMTGRKTFLSARLLLEDISVWFKRQRRSLRKRKKS